MTARVLFPLVFAATAAHAQHLVFTTATPGTSPVWISSPERSKDFGFQSLEILNDSDEAISAVYLKAMFSVEGSPEELADSGHVYVALDPGERKRLDVFLGRIEALGQKLRAARQEVAWGEAHGGIGGVRGWIEVGCEYPHRN
ncbi:MAG TPA: hypothetical protein VH640_10560 [Bryobacteraceae bacterium]|jgi:hypothetical protein